MTVQLALRKDDTRIGALAIQWWTDSPYSHCELVIDGYCHSSSIMDKGVRGTLIDLSPDKWDVIDLPWANAAEVLAYFRRTDGFSYGWFSLIWSQVFNSNETDEDSQFCSEWCAAALGLPNPASYSPATLAAMCLFLSGFAGGQEGLALA